MDPESVACTAELRQRYFPGDPSWTMEEGSVLDAAYVKSLGEFDVVYAWGVLHHTGAMWQALGNVAASVSPGGRLVVAIYNDQGRASRYWALTKRVYNRLPSALRPLILLPAFVRLWGPTLVRDVVQGRPLHAWRTYGSTRGMSPWRDVIDWVGGYPFEVAKPEEVFDFYRARGFVLEFLKTCAGGIGCNEFVFSRPRGGELEARP